MGVGVAVCVRRCVCGRGGGGGGRTHPTAPLALCTVQRRHVWSPAPALMASTRFALPQRLGLGSSDVIFIGHGWTGTHQLKRGGRRGSGSITVGCVLAPSKPATCGVGNAGGSLSAGCPLFPPARPHAAPPPPRVTLRTRDPSAPLARPVPTAALRDPYVPESAPAPQAQRDPPRRTVKRILLHEAVFRLS
jgi:hypothetical protein